MKFQDAFTFEQLKFYKQQFLLDPNIIFLNHGSFGATPKPVFENYQHWQRRIESQPVLFLGREINSLLKQSRIRLADYLHTSPANLVYTTNATHGLNIIARSIHLNSSDNVCSTNHEYGALDRTWRFLSLKEGFEYRPIITNTPIATDEEFVDDYFSNVDAKTKIIFMSHITSPTALIFPVQKICQKARELGIITIIDGAHAPGQLDLNLDDIGADFYVGNLHKWLCAPKGSAFIYARPEVQNLIEPLVVSWGWEAEIPGESQFQDYLEWSGTQDFSSYLAVPTAINFQETNHWEFVRQRCHTMGKQFVELMNKSFKEEPLFSSDASYAQMLSIPLPANLDPQFIKNTLYDEHKIEIPILKWNNKVLIRVSIQAYNNWGELETLNNSLKQIIKV